MNTRSSTKVLLPLWKQPQCFSGLVLPRQIREWLLFPDSLTVELKKMGAELNKQMSIKVLEENIELISDLFYEKKIFRCQFIYTRHIQIFLDDTLLMYAKSTVPKDVNIFLKRYFRGLGNTPLGEILFGVPDIVRSSYELSKITPDFVEFNLACKQNIPFIWGRRSFFSNSVPFLCLAEYFSPDFFLMMTK